MSVVLPVHCCCEPAKRLGWVQVEERLARPGRLRFLVRPVLDPRRDPFELPERGRDGWQPTAEVKG